MAKSKTVYVCSQCGESFPKWMGQCPNCHAWNTLSEYKVEEGVSARYGSDRHRSQAIIESTEVKDLSSVQAEDLPRILTGLREFDRVMGGGLVPGGVSLIGGDPGIGKSTLLLQVTARLVGRGMKTLYVSGEESAGQVAMRAKRLELRPDGIRLMSEIQLETIEQVIVAEKPDFVVIDSIQTMFREDISSAPGSVSQVRESTNLLMQIAKGYGVTIFIVGHVTKEGVVAGPRVLEHMVDTVLYFEGDRNDAYRVLRAVKNRFGSTNEIGVFEMEEKGLSEVLNPSEMLISGRPKEASGAVVACSLEGTRPILLEVQALVTATNFGMARRTANGVDYNRINILLAILEKRCGFAMSRYDAYVNIAGGMKMNEPALDLAVVMALVSSFKNREVDPGMLIFGEVGLSGEVRGVSQAAQRVSEAIKMGFTSCLLPKSNLEKLKDEKRIRLIGVENVREAIQLI